MPEALPSKQVFIIHCSTGCTCCSNNNHWRGPYRTREDAERRITYFRAPDSKFWPLSSQYSKRGNYTIEEAKMEMLPDGRAIMRWEVMEKTPPFMIVEEDGTVADNGAEHMDLE